MTQVQKVYRLIDVHGEFLKHEAVGYEDIVSLFITYKRNKHKILIEKNEVKKEEVEAYIAKLFKSCADIEIFENELEDNGFILLTIHPIDIVTLKSNLNWYDVSLTEEKYTSYYDDEGEEINCFKGIKSEQDISIEYHTESEILDVYYTDTSKTIYYGRLDPVVQERVENQEETFTLTDETTGNTIDVNVTVGPYGLLINPKGYEDANGGAPIMLDFFTNEDNPKDNLSVKIWSDIKSEDITHSISLKRAKTKTVYCECCDSAWLKLQDKGQETQYTCTMCQENEDRVFIPNTPDCNELLLDCGN